MPLSFTVEIPVESLLRGFYVVPKAIHILCFLFWLYNILEHNLKLNYYTDVLLLIPFIGGV